MDEWITCIWPNACIKKATNKIPCSKLSLATGSVKSTVPHTVEGLFSPWRVYSAHVLQMQITGCVRIRQQREYKNLQLMQLMQQPAYICMHACGITMMPLISTHESTQTSS